MDGPGAVPGAITELARRMAGFEIQMGPYAVAELRITELLTSLGAKLPKGGLRLFVTDTLDDPYAAETQLASGLATIAKARREANKIKASQPVTVVIGNPPYRELAAGGGGWGEHGPRAPGGALSPLPCPPGARSGRMAGLGPGAAKGPLPPGPVPPPRPVLGGLRRSRRSPRLLGQLSPR